MGSNLIASASADTRILIWNVKTGSFKFNLIGHTDAVISLAHLDSNQLASGSHDSTVRIWNLTTGMLKFNFSGGNFESIYSLAKLDSNLLASGSSYSTVKIWDLNLGQLKHTFNEHTDTVYALEPLDFYLLGKDKLQGRGGYLSVNSILNCF